MDWYLYFLIPCWALCFGLTFYTEWSAYKRRKRIQAQVPIMLELVNVPNVPFAEDPLEVFVEIFPSLWGDRYECPTGNCLFSRDLADTIVQLNDYHRWTREEIADWLDTLDVDLRFPVADKED